MNRLLPVALLGLSVLASAAVASPRSTYDDRVIGAEVPPISSTLGTFVGVASGDLPGQWRVQIAHQPLASGPSVAISGGTFRMHTLARRTLAGTVTGGSVTVVDRGARCTNQVYKVDAIVTVGRFTGTLTHHRRLLLGRCVVFSATITGSASLEH